MPLPPGVPAPLAEWWQRLVARIIDGLILGVIAYWIVGGIIRSVFSTTERVGFFEVPVVSFTGLLISAIVTTLIYAAYEFFMVSRDGQTIGKKVMKIRIVKLGGSLQGGLDTETLGKRIGVMYGPQILSFQPVLSGLASLFLLVDGLWPLWDKPYQQAIHDKVAGTVVVKL